MHIIKIFKVTAIEIICGMEIAGEYYQFPQNLVRLFFFKLPLKPYPDNSRRCVCKEKGPSRSLNSIVK